MQDCPLDDFDEPEEFTKLKARAELMAAQIEELSGVEWRAITAQGGKKSLEPARPPAGHMEMLVGRVAVAFSNIENMLAIHARANEDEATTFFIKMPL